MKRSTDQEDQEDQEDREDQRGPPKKARKPSGGRGKERSSPATLAFPSTLEAATTAFPSTLESAEPSTRYFRVKQPKSERGRSKPKGEKVRRVAAYRTPAQTGLPTKKVNNAECVDSQCSSSCVVCTCVLQMLTNHLNALVSTACSQSMLGVVIREQTVYAMPLAK